MSKEIALSPNDPNSFSRPEEWCCKHIHLELTVDFEKRVLDGRAVLDFDKNTDGIDHVILDSKDLVIHNITDYDTGEKLQYSLGEVVLSFGSKLQIQLAAANNKNRAKINIEYETTHNSLALQWLTPQQTLGKKHPYVFSQGECIMNRTMLPCQDTPGVKATYSANISCAKELTVLMSAERLGSETDPIDPLKAIYKFRQNVPIPSYLIAIVVGALESRDIGPRSKVWCEKEMLDAAAYEFAETETMLKTAENLCGPYVWGIYDLLVLPPSFPFGGMENPCLTFVTPTLLAGDRSLADVVAHEITHSWTGNLVTNKNFEHFWLNEGFTVFVERKIIGRMHGEPHRFFSAIKGWKDLSYAVNVSLKDNPAYSKLVTELAGVDPDDAFSSVPYEKGSNLLMYLEQLLGGPDVFEPFLKAYIEKFKYKSITTDDWKDFLYSYYTDKTSLLDTVDWKGWLYTPGMPPVKPKYDTSGADACTELCKKWREAADDQLSQFAAVDLERFSSNQIIEFLAQLLDEPPLSHKKIVGLTESYGMNNKKNYEIKFRWIRLCLRAEYEPIIHDALELVTEQGRMKFTRPVYRDLYSWEKTRDKAITQFKKTKDCMHNLCAAMVAKDMHLN